MRVITLDSNKTVISVKNVGDSYVLQAEDIISDIGDIGQVQQADGSFITPPPPVPTLSDVQQAKLTQIDDLYNQALAVGFNSSASGSSVKYGYGDSEQKSFDDLSTMDLRGWVTYPFTVYAMDGTPVSITDKTHLNQLFQDIFSFKYPLKLKQHNYISQVNAPGVTIDQINAIVVTY